MKNYYKKGRAIVESEGFIGLAIKSLQKIQKARSRHTAVSQKIKFVSLVDRKDVLDANWAVPKKPSKKVHTKPYTINWVMSPPRGGGGHQNIFRFIEYMSEIGHKNNVYLYSTLDNMTIEEAKKNVSSYCKNTSKITFKEYTRGKSMAEADVVFATGWETAYPVFNEKTDAKKMYFVQDFEPYFYPMGTNYILAENTYKFGFHGITAGGFLADKLSKDYNMKCDSYDFGAEPELYSHHNDDTRKEVFFYARPVTERRGFDLGIMALELFHEAKPEYIINLAGWDISGYDVPFPYVNHKALQLTELSGLYNKCSAALVVSLTNMSLLPLELLACGTIPVVNDGANNRLVSDNQYIAYTDASPYSLAQELIKVVERKDSTQYARKASASVSSAGWENSKERFLKIIERELG